MEETRSCNTVVVGTVETGKTYTALQFAEMLASRQRPDGKWEQFRPIIVCDHSDNERSYPDFTVFPIEILQYQIDCIANPEYRKMLIKVDGEEGMDEFSRYLVHFVRNAVAVYDDCGNYFEGNLNTMQMTVIKTPKNNGTDIIYQYHLLSEVAKKLLGVTQYFIIKEFADDVATVGRLPCKAYLEILQDEVREENFQRPDGQKYATRILDMKNQRVSVMDMNNKFNTYKSYDYFQNKLKRKR